MFKFDKIIYNIMRDNRLGSYLFTALAFAGALIYIHGLQIQNQVDQAKVLTETTKAMNEAIKSTTICEDELRELRKDFKSLEVDIAILKEKGR
jgi:hypothetical protein